MKADSKTNDRKFLMPVPRPDDEQQADEATEPLVTVWIDEQGQPRMSRKSFEEMIRCGWKE